MGGGGRGEVSGRGGAMQSGEGRGGGSSRGRGLEKRGATTTGFIPY